MNSIRLLKIFNESNSRPKEYISRAALNNESFLTEQKKADVVLIHKKIILDYRKIVGRYH